jgi:hypothetical protein
MSGGGGVTYPRNRRIRDFRNVFGAGCVNIVFASIAEGIITPEVAVCNSAGHRESDGSGSVADHGVLADHGGEHGEAAPQRRDCENHVAATTSTTTATEKRDETKEGACGGV